MISTQQEATEASRGARATPALAEHEQDDINVLARPPGADILRWLVGYTRPYAAKRNTLVVLVVLRSIQLAALAWMTGFIVSGPVAGRSPSGLLSGVLAYLALAAWTQFCFHFRQRLALELGESVVHDLRNDIFTHLQRMNVGFFHRVKLGRIISRITSDVDAVRAGVQDVVFTSLVGLGQMLAAAALMLWYDPVLFLVVAAMGPILGGLNYRFRGRLSRAHRAVQESFSRVTSRLVEAVHGVQVTQGFARQETSARLFRELVADHSKYNLEAARIAGLFVPLLDLNSQSFLASLLIVGGYRVLNPAIAMPAGELIQFLFLANIFFQPIQTLGDQYNQSLLTMAGAERVRRFLSTPPDWVDRPEARPLSRLRGEVTFERVGFAYQAGRPVLADISFTVEPGHTVALVGHTGSGKTSIVNLVAKFYLPTEGRVLIDGHDIRDLSTASLHRKLGIVQQQNFLFSGTVADNIRLGRPSATDAEVAASIERLGCADLIHALPDGLQTEVGESGRNLSVGQRQVVCFARALVADPAILILDEATSAIDVVTEHRIQQALARLVRGRTSFIVAHRLSTIRDADLVLVLSQGRIVERGSHAELVLRAGDYAALHRQYALSIAA
ncbi:MAG: ABC transporter ATP-binding protein [Planctomycetia bacterium]|nr:ABC transporter ATP-binding protein [Planctomycetia bacterium]